MENITTRQRRLLDSLLQRIDGLKVRWDDTRGTAAVLTGALLSAPPQGMDPTEESEAVLKQFLEEYGLLVGPENVLRAHRFVNAQSSNRGHVRIRAMQLADGLPIHGATLLLFADRERGVFRAQSGFIRDVSVPLLEYRGRPVDANRRALALRRRLMADLGRTEEGKRFIKRRLEAGFREDTVARDNFPLAAPPAHWLYPMGRGLRHVFRLNAYRPIEWLGVNGELRKAIDMVDMIVDLASGRTLSQGGRLGAWADVAADGLSTLRESGSYITRTLEAVREDGADRLLVNRDNVPHIITHDAGGTEMNLETKLQNNTDISRDTDGHWDSTTTSCTSTDRRDSQQPEVDGHFFAEEARQYYSQFGWDGFDNGEWGTAPCTVRVAAHIGMDDNAYFWRYIQNGRHFGYVAFYEGWCSGSTLLYDFMAGDPGIVAHEYQHAVTYFGSVDSAGDPGYLETTNWHRAIHEGLSDSVAGLRTETWTAPGIWPNGATRAGAEPFRRIEYPRSTDTKNATAYVDHYDDRVGAGSPYRNSTILSHAIYLAGQGGVHERTSRPAELVPVPSAGRLSIGEVVHYAVTELFDNIPANTAGSHTMIEAANLILDAAEEITGDTRSCEYVMLRRAFYAVGLYPFDSSYVKQPYGGEACMLPWTISWRLSRPYLGFPALWYKSPDLFINNGAGAEYDADVGVENKLFARVRNIGDQALTNVVVRFYFRAHGTNLPSSSTNWKPCKDSVGNDCVLTIPTLSAGSMNFTDENNPPASQAVNWYLDSSEVVAGVDHFCVRAEIECLAANHDNDCPNRVQSNVSFTQPTTADGFGFAFMVAHWGQEPVRLELDIDHTSLPKGFKLHYGGSRPLEEIRLAPGEEIPLQWKIEQPTNGWFPLQPPYGGEVTGKVSGEDLEGEFRGVLSDVVMGRHPARERNTLAIEGRIGGEIIPSRRRRKYRLSGRFTGQLYRSDGRLTGVIVTVPAPLGRRKSQVLKLALEGVLRPTRVVHFTQKVRGKPVGGVSFALRWPKN